MSKVVLLAINAKYIHSSLSVWVLAGGIAQYSRLFHVVEIVEATINQEDSEIVSLVAAQTPDVVGISTYIWNAAKLHGLLSSLRKRLPDTVFVLGGPEASHNADHWIAQGADYIIQGEGEQSLPNLLDQLETHRTQGTQGDGSPVRFPIAQENRPLVFLVFPIDPYSDKYFAELGGRMAYLETSRGCPFSCAFCLSGDSSLRFFPIDSVKDQIKRLAMSGSRTIKLVDRTFNCNTERAYELFEYIIGLDTDCCFHFEVAADLFDEKTLSLLATAKPGSIQLEAGIQSFYPPALEASSRSGDIDKAEQNITSLLQAGNIHLHLDLIAGLPYETLPDFQRGFDRAYALGSHTLQLGFLKLLHGSALREQAASLGICYSPDPPYEITSSPWLSADDLQTLKKAENALQRTYNKGRFLSTLEYVLSATGISPFSLFLSLGNSAPNHGTALDTYAMQLFECFTLFPEVDDMLLKDKLTWDWLSMVKGKNTPAFLKRQDPRSKEASIQAEKHLCHPIRREELTTLNSGKTIYVDSQSRNPVTGLYKVHVL